MKRERDLELRLRSLETLGQAVVAMKSLSAHHFRASREALEPARVYRAGVDRLLESTGADIPAGDGPCGLLVLGGQLGFCGAYNARIAAAATDFRRRHGPGPTVCVGRRAAAYLRRQGVDLDDVHAAPTSIRGTTDALLDLAEGILGRYAAGRLSSFDVLAHEFRGVGALETKLTRLLPVQRQPTVGATAPRYATRRHLAAVALRELLCITLVELQLDALASEHGARLVATQAAEQWLGERIDQLRRRLSAARRETSTQEVIEISAGARLRRMELLESARRPA